METKEERPFICNICILKFKRKHHLCRHLKTHQLSLLEINNYLKLFNSIKDAKKIIKKTQIKTKDSNIQEDFLEDLFKTDDITNENKKKIKKIRIKRNPKLNIGKKDLSNEKIRIKCKPKLNIEKTDFLEDLIISDDIINKNVVNNMIQNSLPLLKINNNCILFTCSITGECLCNNDYSQFDPFIPLTLFEDNEKIEFNIV